jgi:hypothetical protein
MRRFSMLLLPAAALSLLAGCTSAGVIPTGDHSYAALAQNTPVLVYATDREMPPGAEVVGLIDYDNPGKYQVLSLQDVMPEIQDLARSVGANGIVVDSTEAVKSGIVSTGIHVRGRAVHVPRGPS